MARKWLVGLAVLALLVPFTMLSFAQESTVKGNIGGVVVDSTGAVIQDATVTATGATGSRVEKTDGTGNFIFNLLIPGLYSVKVDKTGFKAAEVKGVEVLTGKTSSLKIALEPGVVSEVVEVSATAVVIDTTSASVGGNVTDSFYHSMPIARNVSSLFYITPGVASGGATGTANPSISGASGLENLYVADGVDITDKAYGGLGLFTRAQGSIGTGINMSFIKEVSVKTSGLEPQYGSATGGVVQLVTKSGGNAYHGELGLYAAPQQFEAQYLQSDAVRTNKIGDYLNRGAFDLDGEFGGYVPKMKNRLFFFLSGDPTFNQQFVQAPPTAGLSALGVMKLQTDIYSYDAKLTWKINDKNTVESSLFGDPSHTTHGEQNLVLNTSSLSAMSKWSYGQRSWATRYNGTLSPTWIVNASFTWNNSKFNQTPLFDVLQVTDRTDSTNLHPLQGFGFLENSLTNTYGLNFDTQKIGHWLGTHTLSVGYSYSRPWYTDIKTAPPGRFPTPLVNKFGEAYLGCAVGDPNCPLGQTSYVWAGSLKAAPATCTSCPLYPLGGTGGPGGTAGATMVPVYADFTRGEFDPSEVRTFGRYHAAYANDSWQLNNHINIGFGLRWEQWHMQGTAASYTFTDNWAPRVSVTVDPWGDRKTKVYTSFGRYNYVTPLDAAIRSLSGESDIINLDFAPASSGGNVIINPDKSINVITDAAHLLNSTNPATTGILQTPTLSTSGAGEGFAPGTRMMYQNEWVVGAEHQFKNGVVLSGRFIYRNMPRILEDISGLSPEESIYGNAAFPPEIEFIANPNAQTDDFPNPTESITNAAGCASIPGGKFFFPVVDGNGGLNNPATGAPWVPAGQGVCFAPNGKGFYGGEVNPITGQVNPDGKPDGFPNPKHIYKAVEIEVNKAFANNWMLHANWRIASLTGNYEGAFRNDNGQTDPNISSLYDFTTGIIGMLADQFASGPLNTDRRHIVNVYTSYVFSKYLKNLEVGSGVNFQSGAPISKLGDHTVYTNAGEIPIGGRGTEGRTPFSGTINVHLDRPFRVTEKSQIHVTADLFNLTNSKPILAVDQNYGISGSPNLNPDFLKVAGFVGIPAVGFNQNYQRPFYARFSARWVF